MRGELNQLHIDSILLHAGQSPAQGTGACAVPIYQTSSYVFDNTQHAADLFSLKNEGHIYTRISNPTVEVFEQRLAAMDGGIGALAVSSGMSAIALAILTLSKNGDEIVASKTLYGGTHTLFCHTLRKFGIKVNFVDINNFDEVRSAFNENTKVFYAESIGNPRLNVADIEELSNIAHENDVPFMLDNTVSPYILKPFDFGVDVVVYSTTKFIGGHGTSIGGAIVDSGKFDWNNKKFPGLSEPDPGYHGMCFAKDFAEKGNVGFLLKARAVYLRDIGCAMSPFNAFLFLQGLETLHLRMQRHVSNAKSTAEFLHQHDKISWVIYPGLEASDDYQKAQKYLSGQGGALVGFGIKGGAEAGRKFINSLELVTHLANIGDARTLAIHPASTTHQQLTEVEQIEAGVTPDFIRLSIGIEHIDDICADIDRALAKV